MTVDEPGVQGDRMDVSHALVGVPSADARAALTSHGASVSNEALDMAPPAERPRSLSLDDPLGALAFLASASNKGDTNPLEQHLQLTGVTSNPGSSDDSEAEPLYVPSAPSSARRKRAASNPEGMEKWNSMREKDRRHFVLPESILEEELAEASAAVRKQRRKPRTIPEDHVYTEDVDMDIMGNEGDFDQGNEVVEEDGIDPSTLTPDELLRRARSRLLEDVSQVNAKGDKDSYVLPHSMAKYKAIYNKNGRVGIYTPAERAAIIARYHNKRQRRVWNKKIRYNCRKSLADRRLRVKGRFVKRSEQEQLAKQLAAQAAASAGDEKEGELSDVADTEAGYEPTVEQPYRRLRRHTFA